MWTLVGLGNPDEEYEGTRHNAGRDFMEHISRKNSLSDWKKDKLKGALVAKGELYEEKATFVLPETFMNDSGKSVKHFVGSIKAAEKLIVLQDELDMPLGRVKISFGSGAGGHKGVASIQKAIKTKEFIRIRIGISPATPSGKLKKPTGDQTIDFVLGKFKKTDADKLKKSRTLAEDGIKLILTEGVGKAMTAINSKQL